MAYHVPLLFNAVYETLVTEEGGVFVHDQSAILTAQAMVAFAITDKDTCKALLFKSCVNYQL